VSDERILTKEDRVKVVRLLESGTLENQNLAFNLIEQTAGQEDIAEIFTVNVIVELFFLKGPESLEAMVRAGHLMLKHPETWKVISEAVVDLPVFRWNSFDLEIWLKNELGYEHEASGKQWLCYGAMEALQQAADVSYCWGSESDAMFPDEAFSIVSAAGRREIHTVRLDDGEQNTHLVFFGDLKEIQTKLLPVIDSAKASTEGLDELTVLSDAAAESLSKLKDYLDLSGLTSLSDAAAESLSKHKSSLCLDGLTTLSVAAAESLSKHDGDLSLDLNNLAGKAAARILRKHPSFAPAKRKDLISLEIPQPILAGKSLAVAVQYQLPKSLGKQEIHVTLKGGGYKKGNTKKLKSRISRKVLTIQGSGTATVTFAVPADVPDNRVQIAVFVGSEFRENLQYILSNVLPVR